ncbi:MAG TPA: hypothetical protein PLT31_00985 [Fibrobacteraceae bacterium]|jgi:hypothetical protein|nr:hypothetical protein [Fibrobacter sp.]HPW93738.1 hypothetical protein [Fibrobacteraceae bacterium]
MIFKKILLFVCFLTALSFSQSLTIYRKATDESSPLGTLSYSDWVKELPIKPKKVKKTYYVKNKKGKKVKKVKYETVTPKEPPRFIPVKCKFGSGYANRAELARFFERSKDISGTYSSKTGTAVLQKSPNNPGKFSLVILNGTETERAEFEVGNLELKEANGHSRFRFQEPDCRLDIDYFNRKITILQNGCDAYSTPNFKLGGEYDNYTEIIRRAETFHFPETKYTFKKFLWCPEGPDFCEKTKDENGKVEIVWSVNGEGLIERRSGDQIHTYRPYERMIPNRSDFYDGEKPIALKTKRTDMSSEWMLWLYYPKAERFKMVRIGTRNDAAYTEIYE